MTNLDNKWNEIIKDEDFMRELFALETPETIQEALSSKGIDLTLAEVKELIINTVDAIDAKNSGTELNDSELENVAGGFAWVAAAGLAVAAGMFAGGTYIGWRSAKGRCY